MSQLPKAVSGKYLPENQMAFKLLGCAFVELISENYEKRSEKLLPIEEYFFYNFMPDVRGYKADGEASNEQSWRRWKDHTKSISPLLSRAVDRTWDAYDWAREEGLLSDLDIRLFEEIFGFFLEPAQAKGEDFDEELYYEFMEHVLTYWAKFALKPDNDDGIYLHARTGMEVDSVTLETTLKPSNGKLTNFELVALKLARSLNELARVERLSADDLHTLSLIMLEYSNSTSKVTMPDFKGKPIKSWLADQRIVDEIRTLLMNEIESLVIRLEAVCGRKITTKKISGLKKFIEENC